MEAQETPHKSRGSLGLDDCVKSLKDICSTVLHFTHIFWAPNGRLHCQSTFPAGCATHGLLTSRTYDHCEVRNNAIGIDTKIEVIVVSPNNLGSSQQPISLYSWFLLVLSCNIFLMIFHESIFLTIKLGPTMTSSPRRQGHGLHNPDSSHDQIRCFWLAEVRNFTNIMIECAIKTLYYVKTMHICSVKL